MSSSSLPPINTVDASNQTVIQGLEVSKMVETVNTLQESLSEKDKSELLTLVNNNIKEITD
jgi:hypothetical protein